MSNPILGRGLSSLLPQDGERIPAPPAGQAGPVEKKEEPPIHPSLPHAPSLRVQAPERKRESIFYIELSEVLPNPHQPRKDFDEAGLKELAESIRAHGIIQPLIVTKHEHPTSRGQEVKYEIIAGERRWRAAALANLKHVPVIIRDAESRQKLEMALVENVQRQDLSPLEAASAFRRLADEFGLSQDMIAERVGKSRSAVANTMRLLGLPQEIRQALGENKITEGHARAMLGLAEPVGQLMLLGEVLEKDLTVRDVEELVQQKRGELGIERKHRAAVHADPEVKEFESKLEEALGTKVALRGRATRGKIVVEFYSREDLQRIIEKLSHPDEKVSN